MFNVTAVTSIYFPLKDVRLFNGPLYSSPEASHLGKFSPFLTLFHYNVSVFDF